MESVRISMEWIVLDWKKHLACLLVTMISGILVMMSVSLYLGIYIGYDNCNEILTGGVSRCAVVKVTDVGKSCDEFNKELSGLEGVRAAGTMDTRAGYYSGVEELIKIQEGHTENYGNSLQGLLEVKIVNPALLPICEMELQEGCAWTDMEHSDDSVVYLYLGNAFQGVPAGTRYEQPDGSVLEVAGILKKNSRFLKNIEGYLSPAELSAVALDYTEDCTYSVFCVRDYALTGFFYISAEDGYEIEKVVQSVRALAERKGLHTVYYTFPEIFERGYETSRQLVRYMLSLIVICLVCSLLVTVSFRLIAFWEQAGNLGVMLAMGFSPKFLLKVYLVKDAINAGLAFLGMSSISLFLIRLWFIGDEAAVIFRRLFLHYMAPAAVVPLLAETALSGAVTYRLLEKNGPARLLGK